MSTVSKQWCRLKTRLPEIKKGMLTDNAKRPTAHLKHGATYPLNVYLLSAYHVAAVILSDH